MKKKLWVGILIGVIFGMLLLPLTTGGQQESPFQTRILKEQ
jgi:hypothetical protein